MVAAIAADETALKPLIISLRKTIEVELILWGLSRTKSDFRTSRKHIHYDKTF
jgi:hypothetical protein